MASESNQVFVAKWLLRLGLAFVFLYASIEIFFNPESFAKYIPDFLRNMVPDNYFLPIFSIVEIALVFWLISNWKVRYAAIFSFLILTGIIILNLENFSILFRNVAIALAALALFFLEQEN